MLGASSSLNWALAALAAAQTIAATAVLQPGLDLGALGRVVIGGRFSGLGLYQDTRQRDTLANGTTDALVLYSTDGYASSLGSSDGTLAAVCALNSTAPSGGTLLFVAGNFSRIGNVAASNVARYDTASRMFAPLGEGVSGTVSTLYCDAANRQVYLGGDFTAANATNAALWSASSDSFITLPFGGFDGPVGTIAARNGSILYGGRFDMIDKGTTAKSNTSQRVNLQSAFITSQNPSSIPGFIDPNNILCSSKQDVAGSVWLAADNVPAAWSAALNFTIRPTKFRLYNTRRDGRGVKEFRFVAKPIDGILNLTYIDPATNQRLYCDARCPLSNAASVEYTEFEFVNVIQMTGFELAISAWYGPGAGLRGIELFTEDINAYAVTAFNAPTCAPGLFTATSLQTGSWTPVRLGTDPGFLSTTDSTARVAFYPQITQRGTYAVRLYTPGCLIDGTCATRGAVLVSIYATPDAAATNVTLFQTNNYEKYDTVYQGTVAAASGSFRPRVLLSTLSDPAIPIKVTVASRVQFIPLSTLEGADALNGLFEYDPTATTLSTLNATADRVGRRLNLDAIITKLINVGGTLYGAGNFSGNGIANIFKLDGDTLAAPGNAGPNAGVSSLAFLNGTLYLAGNFTALVNETTSAMHVVAFDTARNAWLALGAGLNGDVRSVVVVNNTLAFSGNFSQINAAGSSPAQAVQGAAFWTPATGAWSSSLGTLGGALSSALTNADGTYLTGTPQLVPSLNANGLASLVSTSNGTTRVRALTGGNNSVSAFDVQTLSFYNTSGRSLTVVGGRFSTVDSQGRTLSNVALLSTDGSVSGLTNAGGLAGNSTVLATLVDRDLLFLGGALTSSISTATLGGLAIYNLADNIPATVQPAALTGPAVRVQSLAMRRQVRQLVVAGAFDQAGSLSCPGFCVLDLATTTWQRPGAGFQGNVSQVSWINDGVLLLAGDLQVNGTRMALATFAFETGVFDAVTGVQAFPGPATVAVTDTNATSSLYVAGARTDGLGAYLSKWNGTTIQTLAAEGLAEGSVIYDLQFVELAKRAEGAGNTIMASDRRLLVAGRLNLTGNGTFAAALFDGVRYTPYLLAGGAGSTGGDIDSGIIRTLFTEQQVNFNSARGSGLSRGAVIGIALAMALFVVFMVVALGILVAWLRRRSEGYRPANQQMTPVPAGSNVEKRPVGAAGGPSPDYTMRPSKS